MKKTKIYLVVKVHCVEPTFGIAPDNLYWVGHFSLLSKERSKQSDTNHNNQQMAKDTSSISPKGQSSQYTKSGLTKPRESISRRRTSYKTKISEVLPSCLSTREVM